MDIAGALVYFLKSKNKVAAWSCGETYESLTWSEENTIDKPSLKQLEKAWDEYLKEWDDTEYQRKRKAAYPSIEEQLDVLYEKGVDGLRDKLNKIKNQFPKEKNKVEVKPKDKVDDSMAELKINVQALADNTVVMQQQVATMQQFTKDTADAIAAINGFMKLIPEMQKDIQGIKEQMNKDGVTVKL